MKRLFPSYIGMFTLPQAADANEDYWTRFRQGFVQKIGTERDERSKAGVTVLRQTLYCSLWLRLRAICPSNFMRAARYPNPLPKDILHTSQN